MGRVLEWDEVVIHGINIGKITMYKVRGCSWLRRVARSADEVLARLREDARLLLRRRLW